ncbi:cohesin domain-containing protein [Leifsonia sp. F6_8S_P_1B]|uniref:Cohesin domain-containing protein n=1 Tax=Leifsonia williamsii TaxID=3035919 RepID=A0ABT8KAC1_9MICO|nr:cohesin domain-containing protein [Leifsonia williamsii]MDN4613756.1 cohesin domain-containing protein [Leifsonia williamsii]
MHHTPRRLVRLLALTAAALAGAGLAAGAAAPAFAAPAVARVTVSAPATVTAGDEFDVTVTLAGAADVFGYESVLAFDPTVAGYVDGSAVVTAGGYDAVETGTDTVDLVYTRLGTSPSLSGDIAFTLTFSAKAAGSTAFAVRSLSLVDPASAVTPLADAATSPAVSVTPAATPPTPPAPTPTPTPTAGAPAPGGSGDGGGTDPAGTGDPVTASQDDLASTGSDLTLYVIAAGVLVALGTLAALITFRRREGEAR